MIDVITERTNKNSVRILNLLSDKIGSEKVTEQLSQNPVLIEIIENLARYHSMSSIDS